MGVGPNEMHVRKMRLGGGRSNSGKRSASKNRRRDSFHSSGLPSMKFQPAVSTIEGGGGDGNAAHYLECIPCNWAKETNVEWRLVSCDAAASRRDRARSFARSRSLMRGGRRQFASRLATSAAVSWSLAAGECSRPDYALYRQINRIRNSIRSGTW